MEKLLASVLAEAFELYRATLSEEDGDSEFEKAQKTGKPHQVASRKAFRATVDADDHTDHFKMGKERNGAKLSAYDVHKTHKTASDAHMDAAKHHKSAGQHGSARDHAGAADKHAKLAAHYYKLHQNDVDDAKKGKLKASGAEESVESTETVIRESAPSPLLGAGRKYIGSARDHLKAAGLDLTEEALPWWTNGIDKL